MTSVMQKGNIYFAVLRVFVHLLKPCLCVNVCFLFKPMTVALITGYSVSVPLHLCLCFVSFTVLYAWVVCVHNLQPLLYMLHIFAYPLPASPHYIYFRLYLHNACAWLRAPASICMYIVLVFVRLFYRLLSTEW